MVLFALHQKPLSKDRILRLFIRFIYILAALLYMGQTHGWGQVTKKPTKPVESRADSIARVRKYKQDSLLAVRKHALDSANASRKHALDSATRAREARADSIRISRDRKADSVAKARKKVSDSAAAIRKYKESKKCKDSIAKSKLLKTKALTDSRKARTDSLQRIRQHATDSTAAIRKVRTDSMRNIQKKRTDSLARVKKYKASKRYTDSVTLAKRHRTDSFKAVQKLFRDSITTTRKRLMDSAKLVRTKKLDSVKLIRKRHTDSLASARKAKTDSIAKKKDVKTKLAKANEKKKQEALKLKLELKLKQKREEWSNKTMLKKPWGPKRRFFQNSFTHYNYYYNANRKMEEASLNMQRANKDNYDTLIGLFPFDPLKDSSLMSADMDSIIRKVSVGIQIHDPRTKWGNDMYLLLGQAYYYKGGFENASIAFRYIIANDQKNKLKNKKGSTYSRSKEAPSIVDKKKKSKLAFWQHKSVHNDAILWLARTYVTAGQIDNAGSVLSLLEFDSDLPENLKGRLAIEKAFTYLKTYSYPEASEQLEIARLDNNLPKWLRVRAAFLNGQILQRLGNHELAATNFEFVLDFYPKLEMDFYARKYIADNRLMAGTNVANATTPLRKMLRDAKYANYYDQVYYVLGKLEARAGDINDAATYFTKSTTVPKASKKQKALSFAALGDVYYSSGQYQAAKAAYDSAGKYSGGVKDKSLAVIAQRTTGLSEMAGPANLIRETDSLLRMAAMSKREQQQIAKRFLRELERKIEDSIAAAENAGVAAAAAENTGEDRGNAGGWYFSNPSLISQGSTDFKRKWGGRPLTDNWRRASGAPLAGGSKSGGGENGGSEDENDSELVKGKDKNGLPTEEALLAKVPNTPQQKELAEKILHKSYILLAKAYVKQLDDNEQAIKTLDTLNKRFPNHTQKEEELYLRYQIAVKKNQFDKAQAYATALLEKFPNSQYAKLLQPGKSESKLTNDNTNEVARYFDETYALLLKHQYSEALLRAENAQKKYENAKYRKRFDVVQAMAYAGSGNYLVADSLISQFIKANPTDSLNEWAAAVKTHIQDMKNGGKPAWYTDKPYVYKGNNTAKPVTSSDTEKPENPSPTPPQPEVSDVPVSYIYEADSPHMAILVLPGLDDRTADLKKKLKRFDSLKMGANGHQLLLDFYRMKEAVMIVKGFSNASQAKTYMNELKTSDSFIDFADGEVNLMVISGRNYKKMFAEKSTESYLTFFNNNYLK
jgi:outer membrane protein assembly factor BamD (BamD/ComL family)